MKKLWLLVLPAIGSIDLQASVSRETIQDWQFKRNLALAATGIAEAARCSGALPDQIVMPVCYAAPLIAYAFDKRSTEALCDEEIRGVFRRIDIAALSAAVASLGVGFALKELVPSEIPLTMLAIGYFGKHSIRVGDKIIDYMKRRE